MRSFASASRFLTDSQHGSTASGDLTTVPNPSTCIGHDSMPRVDIIEGFSLPIATNQNSWSLSSGNDLRDPSMLAHTSPA